MYEVESNIPLPEGDEFSLGRKSKYGFHRLEAGQSIFVPDQQTDGGASKAARDYARRHGVKFVIRAIAGGVRIWRTE